MQKSADLSHHFDFVYIFNRLKHSSICFFYFCSLRNSVAFHSFALFVSCLRVHELWDRIEYIRVLHIKNSSKSTPFKNIRSFRETISLRFFLLYILSYRIVCVYSHMVIWNAKSMANGSLLRRLKSKKVASISCKACTKWKIDYRHPIYLRLILW